MPKKYDVLPRRFREGTERFRSRGADAGFGLDSFWRWANSDLVVNTTRGVLAEYLVSRALGEHETARDTWRAFDVLSNDGVTVEVKSASYFQTWAQDRLTDISFQIPLTRFWDPHTGEFGAAPKRHAQVYVFCLLAHKDRDSLDPLDLSQWEFFVVPTSLLDRDCGSQDSIGLARVRQMAAGPVAWDELSDVVSASAAIG